MKWLIGTFLVAITTISIAHTTISIAQAQDRKARGGILSSRAMDELAEEQLQERLASVAASKARMIAAGRLPAQQLSIPLADNDLFGTAVASTGDLNHDNISDLAVGARGDDAGGVDAGAVWVLFLDEEGGLESTQKIGSSTGGFTGSLTAYDHFGQSLASPGALKGDGTTALAVGAPLDDDGGTNRGAVWILFLNDDGAVVSHQKISDTRGGFGGELADDDEFGKAVASIGDLDKDGVEDLIVGAPKKGGRGGVWILFLNREGTVKSHQEISITSGGFSGNLDTGDEFGWSVARAGDIDADGNVDVAVGARQDDDGGLNAGAIWILFLNEDGTVKTYQKISDTEGGFAETLDDYDFFGASIANLGDLTGDGRPELAVGAERDDDSGLDQGAVWILSLNPDGTVFDVPLKLAEGSGMPADGLDTNDLFGSSLSWHSKGPDGPFALAVGAREDDDGGMNRGAVWLLDFEAGHPGEFSKISDQTKPPILTWPLKPAIGFEDAGYHGISNYVDQGPPGVLLDYNCGNRTYDGHNAIDYFLWPFPWLKMDNDDVEIVAAAQGTIVDKRDGQFDRNCGPGQLSNFVAVQHEDGTTTHYVHMKNGSVTTRSIGAFVERGEYLGVVGSSGNSSEPHLHFATIGPRGNVLDPYSGACNDLNATSLWDEQHAYFDSAINKIMTATQAPEFGGCDTGVTHASDTFEQGDQVFFVNFYRDQLGGQTSVYTIFRPDETVFDSWTHTPESFDHSPKTWWYWIRTLPADAQEGRWIYQVLYEGVTYIHTFTVEAPPEITTVSLNLESGWNLVGVPVKQNNMDARSLFPHYIPGKLLSYENEFYVVPADSLLEHGKGYWVAFDQKLAYAFTGEVIEPLTLSLEKGWNMISGPSCDYPLSAIEDPAGIVVPNTLFRYDTTGGYVQDTKMTPGKGYWMLTTQAGPVTLDCRQASLPAIPFPARQEAGLSKLGRLVVRDASGSPRTVYFGTDPDIENDLLHYRLPPQLEKNQFDIRFSNERFVNGSGQGVIRVSGYQAPLRLRLQGDALQAVYVTVRTEQGSQQEMIVAGEERILSASDIIALEVEAASEYPRAFSLRQNYPDPFNLQTTISYSIPHQEYVKIRLYDVLGREIKILVDEVRPAGVHDILLDASDLANGVYFYRMNAGAYDAVRSMIFQE